jgi:hypothetical protein
MNVGDLIKKLKQLPPETVVVRLNSGPEGYDEVHFAEGTHNGNGEMKLNRARWIKGQDHPDFLTKDEGSRAEGLPFVLFY